MAINQLIGTHSTEESEDDVLVQAVKDLELLSGIAPLEKLSTKAGKDFGRSIEASLNALAEVRLPMKIKIRNSDKAVVMPIEQYQAILNMKEHMSFLVKKVKEIELENSASQFDALFMKITSPASRRASDTLFKASEDDLNSSFKG